MNTRIIKANLNIDKLSPAVKFKYQKFLALQQEYQARTELTSSNPMREFRVIKEFYIKFRTRMAKTLALHNRNETYNDKSEFFDLFILLNKQAEIVNLHLEEIANDIASLETAQRSKQFHNPIKFLEDNENISWQIDMIEFVKIELQKVEHNIFNFDFYSMVDQTQDWQHNLIDIQLDIDNLINFAEDQLAERKDTEAVTLLKHIKQINANFGNKSERMIQDMQMNVEINPIEQSSQSVIMSSLQIKSLNKLNEEKPVNPTIIQSNQNNISNVNLYNSSLTQFDDSQMSDSDATQPLPITRFNF